MYDYLVMLKTPLKCEWRIKYFAVRWLQVYGPDRRVARSVKLIAADLDIIDNAVSEGISWLTNAGFMTKTKLVSGQGRPRHTYQWVSCTGSKSAFTPHRGLIDHLLSLDKKTIGSLYPELTRQNRLLLSVLLAHADSCGVVQNLSQTKLAALTGMDKRAIARRTNALLAAGKIRWYCAGIRGYRLFGPTSGMYFLNLTHPVYGSKAAAGLITLFRWNVGDQEQVSLAGREFFIMAEGLWRDMKKNRSALMQRRLVDAHEILSVDAGFVKLVDLFVPTADGWKSGRERYWRHIAAYLQRKIESYASYLLSERWHELSPKVDVYAPKLLDTIRQDLDPGTSDEYCYRHLAITIYLTSQRLARRLKTWLSAIPNAEFESMTHCIMPVPSELPRAPFRTIVSIPSSVVKHPLSGTIRVTACLSALADFGIKRLDELGPFKGRLEVGRQYKSVIERRPVLVELLGKEDKLEPRELTMYGLSMNPERPSV